VSIMADRRGFTLIEVLISVALLSVAASAIFALSTSQKRVFEFSKERFQVSALSSVIYQNYDEKLDKSTKDIYEIIKSRYSIDNDDIRRYLKDKKATIKKNLYKNSYFLASLGEDEESDNEEGILPVEIDRVYLFDEDKKTFIYTLKGAGE